MEKTKCAREAQGPAHFISPHSRNHPSRPRLYPGRPHSVRRKKFNPTLADAILHPATSTPDVKELNADLQKLLANPKTNNAAWINELAGTYLRLGQPAEAVKILEPLTNHFATNYALHANLGTAYHLLGRYVEAEREIRRDTEINTNAHFGLEKYHLALLQYLIRNDDYRLHHLYVDEFSTSFAKYVAMEAIQMDKPSKDWPQYRQRWNLLMDEKLEPGVIYMATLNPKEPACWVMLGMVAEWDKNFHLANTAYAKAIELGSPQSSALKERIKKIENVVAEMHKAKMLHDSFEGK